MRTSAKSCHSYINNLNNYITLYRVILKYFIICLHRNINCHKYFIKLFSLKYLKIKSKIFHMHTYIMLYSNVKYIAIAEINKQLISQLINNKLNK